MVAPSAPPLIMVAPCEERFTPGARLIVILELVPVERMEEPQLSFILRTMRDMLNERISPESFKFPIHP